MPSPERAERITPRFQEAVGAVEARQRDLIAARELLHEAEQRQQEALAAYQRVLDDIKAELPPEEVAEAYGAVLAHLEVRLREALVAKDFTAIDKIVSESRALQEKFEQDMRTIPKEVGQDLLRLFKEHHVAAAQRAHYINRTRRLIEGGADPSVITEVIEAEIQKKPAARRSAGTPFTGWEESRPH